MQDVLEEELLPNPPKEGMEYIYRLDMTWPIYEEGVRSSSGLDEVFIQSKEQLDAMQEKPYSIKIEPYQVVTDVEKTDFGYEFTIKDWGLRCICHYPWAFWENTPENRVMKIEEYKREYRELKKQEKYVDYLRERIDQIREEE